MARLYHVDCLVVCANTAADEVGAYVSIRDRVVPKAVTLVGIGREFAVKLNSTLENAIESDFHTPA